MNKWWVKEPWNDQCVLAIQVFLNKSQKNFWNFDVNVLSTDKATHKLLNSLYLLAERKKKRTEKLEINLHVKLLPRDGKLWMKAIIILVCEV